MISPGDACWTQETKSRPGLARPPRQRWWLRHEASATRTCCAQPLPSMRSACDGAGPRRGIALRALRLAAAPMRKLSRHRRPIRSFLRVLRSRARARRRAPDLVAALDARGPGSAGCRADGWHLVGADARQIGRLSIQSVAALDTEAVSAQVVMAARGADKPARRIRLQPALTFAPVPDPILRTEHPAPAFAVEHREVSHRKPKRARLQRSGAALFDQQSIPRLSFGKWVDGHSEKVADSVGCRIR
jgi:hypothetical protein